MYYISGSGVYVSGVEQFLILLQQISVPLVLNTFAEPETIDAVHFVKLYRICSRLHACTQAHTIMLLRNMGKGLRGVENT